MEKVNHPNHYNIKGKKECIEQMREDYGDTITSIFCLTNAYKYLYRAGEKFGESARDDIAKAEWYYDYQDTKLCYTLYTNGLERLKTDVLNKLKEME